VAEHVCRRSFCVADPDPVHGVSSFLVSTYACARSSTSLTLLAFCREENVRQDHYYTNNAYLNANNAGNGPHAWQVNGFILRQSGVVTPDTQQQRAAKKAARAQAIAAAMYAADQVPK
jgi:hypothetical protein